eukprot:scaffold2466_cov333-Pavlova_lutheri.AAC.4
MHVFGRLPLPPAVVSRIVPITTITHPRGSPAQLGCFLGSFPPSWSRAISVSGRLNRAIHYMPVPKEVRWTPTTQVVNFHDGGLMSLFVQSNVESLRILSNGDQVLDFVEGRVSSLSVGLFPTGRAVLSA